MVRLHRHPQSMDNNPENNVPHEVVVITPKGKRKTIRLEPDGVVETAMQLGGKLLTVDNNPVIEDHDVHSYPVAPKEGNKVQ